MSDDKRSLEQIEAEIAETRREIGEDVEELKYRLSREHLKEQARERLRATGDAALSRMQDAGRRARDSAMGVTRDAERMVRERAEQVGSSLPDAITENSRSILGAGLIVMGIGTILLGLNSRRKGVRVTESIVIDQPAWRLYDFWRQLANLPRFMEHLESVTWLDSRRSHWVAKGPSGSRVAWNAVIVDDIEDEFISWRSVAGSDIPNSGWVSFRELPTGTEVTVSLVYMPPGGALGAAVASLFGEEPHQQISEDLEHLKEMLEGRRIPAGQSRAARGSSRGGALMRQYP